MIFVYFAAGRLNGVLGKITCIEKLMGYIREEGAFLLIWKPSLEFLNCYYF